MNRPLFFLLATASAGLLFPGCERPSAPGPPPAPEVTVARAVLARELDAPFTDYEDFSGRTRPAALVEIRARVEGYLLDVAEYARGYRERSEEERKRADAENRRPREFSPDRLPIDVPEGGFQEGGVVEAGEVLFVIDPEPFELARDAAEASLAASQARVDLTRATFARYERLIDKDAVTMQEYQTNKANLDVALAQAAADRVAVRDAEIKLGYTILRAPFRGRVDRKLVDPGNLVGASEKTLLTTFAAENPIHVYFDVSEKVVLQVLKWRRDHAGGEDEAKKLEVRLKLENEETFDHVGYIDYLENQVDPATGTALIRAVFDNAGGHLYPGLSVQVRVPGEEKPDAVLVREEAIGTDLGGKYVMVVEERDGREMAAVRRVELGTLQGSLREVTPVRREDGPMIGGVEPGERYITQGLQRARDSMPVTVTATLGLSPPAAESGLTAEPSSPPAARLVSDNS